MSTLFLILNKSLYRMDFWMSWVSMGIIKKIIFEKNKITSHFRELPDFLILGNTFCGKTLLYNYLIQHKLVIENFKEETGFFNVYLM